MPLLNACMRLYDLDGSFSSIQLSKDRKNICMISSDCYPRSDRPIPRELIASNLESISTLLCSYDIQAKLVNDRRIAPVPYLTLQYEPHAMTRSLSKMFGNKIIDMVNIQVNTSPIANKMHFMFFKYLAQQITNYADIGNSKYLFRGGT